MNLAITGDRGLLGAALARVLGDAYSVRVAPEGDLCDETFARQVVAGCQALIHLAPLYPDLPASVGTQLVLDQATRGTYVLFQAAVAAGVERVILGSTLALLERCPPGWAVSEAWQPRPDVTDLSQLAAYLAEESARQFALAGPLTVICLRLGEVVETLLFTSLVNPETAAAQPGGVHPMSISWEDAGLAVRRALETPDLPSPFERLHILADLPHGTYSAAKARRLLGWRPRDNLAHLWAQRPT